MSTSALQTSMDEAGDGDPSGTVGSDMLQLLSHRYGDGLVYLREAGERGLFDRAIRLGLISSEGFLTPAGRSALARDAAD